MPTLPDALAGVNIFPVQPGDKLPALSYGWQTRATDDAEQVAEWERGMANLNWGVAAGTSGLFIFDIDPSGLEKWNELQQTIPGLREAVAGAFTVRTPRGGFHVYFRGQGPTTASAIAPGIDTRGGYVDERTGKYKSLGYVVAPGSRTVARADGKTVDGDYEYIGGDIIPMPPPVLQIVPDRKRGTAVGLDKDVAKDNPRNIKTARDLLEKYVLDGRVSIEGQGGDNTCYQVVASVLDKGISPGTAFELLDEIWNPHCSPPWEDWELEKKITNALAYGEETGDGAKGFLDNGTAFEKFAGMEVETGPVHRPSRRDRLQWIDDYAANVRDPEWLLPGYIPAHGIGMLYGASGSYKSFVALDMASCLAHGHAGQWGAPPVANDVIYFAGEGPIGTAKQRRPAWLEWQQVTSPHRLAIFPRVPFLGDMEGWEGVKIDVEEMGLKPKLIVIDTLTRLLLGFDENTTKDANKATGFLEDLARFYECFVLCIHHTGKDEKAGARGSSAFFANMDTVLSTKKRGKGTALHVRKHKDADAPDNEQLLKVREFGRSIVLEKTDHLDDFTGEKSSKVSWTEPQEILGRIAKEGGKVSHGILAQGIASALNLDVSKVKTALSRKQEIQYLRDGDYWRIPEGPQEFDL